MKSRAFPEGFGKTVTIGSGALGCNLRPHLELSTAPVELLNLHNPDVVRDLHAEYVEAGSQVLITNTFGSNLLALREFGLESSFERINRAGVELAQAASGGRVPVWASVGPLHLGLGVEDYTEEELVDIFAAQCAALSDADALLFETFTSLREAQAALRAARKSGLPFVFQVGTIGSGHEMLQRTETFLQKAVKAGASAVGANCQHPNRIVDTIEYIAARVDVPVTAAANAGHPSINRGIIEYEFPPSKMAETGKKLVEKGASQVGGCCGTTPGHIRALVEALSARTVVAREKVPPAVVHRRRAAADVKAGLNPVRELVEKKKFLISVEIRANRNQSLKEIIAGASEIAKAGADLFDVPDNAGANVGRDPMVVAASLQKALCVPAIQHKTVTQCNLLALHSGLIGGWDLGLRGILVITGDAPSMGHLGAAAGRVKDLKSSVELLRLIRRMHLGEMINGEPIADAPDYCAGCSVSSIAGQAHVKWLEKKAAAGAQFVFSQPFFRLDDYRKLRDALSHIPIRFIPGIMPLVSRRNAAFMAAGHIPGIQVPEHLVDQFSAYESKTDQRKFGLETALRFAQKLRDDGASGLYIIMPFGRSCYADTASLVRALSQDTVKRQQS